MHTTYHFGSTSEITSDIIDSIKSAFKDKPVTITVEEDMGNNVPDWQQEMVYNRLKEIKNFPEKALNEEAFQKAFSKIGK